MCLYFIVLNHILLANYFIYVRLLSLKNFSHLFWQFLFNWSFNDYLFWLWHHNSFHVIPSHKNVSKFKNYICFCRRRFLLPCTKNALAFSLFFANSLYICATTLAVADYRIYNFMLMMTLWFIYFLFFEHTHPNSNKS